LLFGHFVMMPFNLTLCVFCCSVILSWCPSTWPCVCFVVRSFCHDALQLDPVCVLLFGHFAMMPFNLTLCVFCCSVILPWCPLTWPCVCFVVRSFCHDALQLDPVCFVVRSFCHDALQLNPVYVLLFGHFVMTPFNLTLCVLLFGHFVMMPFNLTLCVFSFYISAIYINMYFFTVFFRLKVF